jgi:hypothetical protein
LRKHQLRSTITTGPLESGDNPRSRVRILRRLAAWNAEDDFVASSNATVGKLHGLRNVTLEIETERSPPIENLHLVPDVVREVGVGLSELREELGEARHQAIRMEKCMREGPPDLPMQIGAFLDGGSRHAAPTIPAARPHRTRGVILDNTASPSSLAGRR